MTSGVERAALSCEALGACRVVRFAGVEGIDALPTFDVEVLAPDADRALASLIGQAATLAFVDEAAGAREVPLVVVRARYSGAHRDGHRYGLSLSSRAQALALRSGYRVFQHLTAAAIVRQMLEDAGIGADEQVWRLSGRYPERVYTVQYGETDWAFVTRLLGDDGIALWFDADDDGAPRVVFGDGSSSHDGLRGGEVVRFSDPSGLARSPASFFALERAHELCHDSVHLRAFDVRQPDVPIEARVGKPPSIEGTAGDGALEHYEVPAGLPGSEAIAARARVRLEQLRRFAVRVEARSGCARLAPGRVVRVEGCADPSLDGEHLVVEVRHELVQSTRNAPEARPYANEVVLVPHGRDRAFRPAAPVGPRGPVVEGIETAVVTGPPGEEIHVDDLGCIKARFRWDRSGVGDDRSSRWIRTLQPAMRDAMLLPRVGWEVPVVYEEGDPDRPICLGRLYHAGARTPYSLPVSKATTAFQSATSPSDGTTHEIRLADDTGRQEAFVHATKDLTITVGGTATVQVGVNAVDDVKKSASRTVLGAQSVLVGAAQAVDVGGDATVAVKGGRTESIGALESVGVTGSQHVECKGAYGEVVGAVYGIQCNQSNTVVQGAFTQTVAGAMALTAGLGTNQSVAAARSEEVGGAYTVRASTYADTTKGAKSIAAGASTDTAKGHVVTYVGAAGSITIGGGASMTAGGKLAIAAPNVTVQVAGSIDVRGGTLELGGKLETTAKTKLDAATTKKKATSKVGS